MENKKSPLAYSQGTKSRGTTQFVCLDIQHTSQTFNAVAWQSLPETPEM
ncbi:hypothetical protein CUZ89_0915 [Enterococcus xinjiangensis]|nr:hypothetical protein [Enterococcus lactis]MBL4990830.1 hypothetical protein [Enterococcus lactis]MBL5002734.1 hypothetical protein [Enterococcus lactis]